jgi:hypothetical protein
MTGMGRLRMLRTKGVLICAAQLAVLAAVFAGAGKASTSDVPNLTVSPNWSGYVATGRAGQPGFLHETRSA